MENLRTVCARRVNRSSIWHRFLFPPGSGPQTEWISSGPSGAPPLLEPCHFCLARQAPKVLNHFKAERDTHSAAVKEASQAGFCFLRSPWVVLSTVPSVATRSASGTGPGGPLV